MATIKSIFGAYADNLQLIIDSALEKFAPTSFQAYMTWGTPSPVLTFESAIGRSRIEAAASVVNRDSPAPLRSRAGLETLRGEVPAIKEKFKLTETDYRNFLILQNMNVADGTKKQQLLDLLFNDVRKVGDAAMKRLDYMFLEGLSTGKITVTTTNNPDGVVATTDIDLLLSASNKKSSTVTWNAGDATTPKPITDIGTVVEDASNRGISFAKILMTRATWLNFINTKQVVDSLTGYYRLAKGTITPTLDQVNQFLTSNLYPTIEIVQNNKIGIEKDGVITAQQPFSDNSAVFVPAGTLGTIQNAIAIEELQPVKQLTYAKFNNALISKWQENEPFAEFTKVELNAFPSFDAIDQIYILTVNH
jgi:hypothetical protein